MRKHRWMKSPLYSISDTQRSKPLVITPRLNGTELKMEIDTGASLSLMSEETYHRVWEANSAPPLLPSTANLRTYTGERIATLGRIEVEVSINVQTAHLSLEVVKGAGPSLLGVDWLQELRLDWKQIFKIRCNRAPLQEVLDSHKAVFKDTLGCIKGVKARLHLKQGAHPKF